jgi:hypothetical protein
MATWNPADELNHPLDFLLIQNGFVSMFLQPAVLQEALSWLQARGYHIVSMDAASWLTPADMHADIARALDFPGYYGANLDALEDCLRDVAVQSYGWSEPDTGLVLVINGYDAFAARDEGTAHSLLDVYARQAAYAALFGHRLMCLITSGDPEAQIAPVGATTVSWNHWEFLESSRKAD